MNNKNHNQQNRSRESRLPVKGLPHDALDALLRTWHDENAERASAGRAQLLAQLAASHEQGAHKPSISFTAHVRTLLHSRALRAAASFALLITTLAIVISLVQTPANAATRQIMVPEGGRLDAVDTRGNLIGPCALAHTDVKVNVAGPFTRVRVKQDYQNPYNVKIEAVYTFPLSNRAAVDGMTMTIHSPEGDRVVVAESRERQQARQIYENARQAGNVASLLEQERPNIFTQSVANIEPLTAITIEISYVEMLQSKDGEYTFDFPMVVAPRYMPGSPLRGSMGEVVSQLPQGLDRRWGIILKAPASFERVQVQLTAAPDGSGGIVGGGFTSAPLGPAPQIGKLIDVAVPINPPASEFRMREENQKLFYARPGIDFYVTYADGTREFGQISGEGLGHIAGRWFWLNPANFATFDRNDVGGVNGQSGTGYEQDTAKVPDASRISPRPVRPPMRAGHDVSLSVSIDTGGPAIIDYNSDLHEIRCTDGPRYKNLGDKINLSLQNRSEIPNRDFVLHWRTTNDRVQEASFAYLPNTPVDEKGGFFTLVLAPPAKVDKDNIVPRELVFVLDTSGSMSGEPLEKAKAVMARAIDAMWPTDTFNFITFSGDTHILWDRPRPNTEANRAEAQQFLASRSGDGGTEMMKAIDAALAPTSVVADTITAAQLADLPADGRAVRVRAAFDEIEAEVMKSAVMNPMLRVRPDLALRLSAFHFPVEQMGGNPQLVLAGVWSTINGERTLQVAAATRVPDDQPQPLRIVMFLTDGQVGNDEQIIRAVRDHAKTSRVFSFGIGDSPNRSLLDGMAKAGRGEVEYVNLQNNPDAAVQRFARRIASPVLTDISLTFAPGVTVSDTIPPLDAIPDLFDVKPLIIHGRFALNGNASGAGGAGVPGGTGVSPVKTAVTLRGRTAAGPYERAIELDLSAQHGAPTAIAAGRAGGQGVEEDSHRVLATLWARAKVEELGQSNADASRNRDIIGLGERFNIMTPLTSFVAVEKSRLTIQGRTVLVPIPVELPQGEQWEAFFFGTKRDARQQAAAEIREIVDRLRVRASAIESGSAPIDPTLVEELRKLRAEAVSLDRKKVELDEAGRDVMAQLEVSQHARRALEEELRKVDASLVAAETRMGASLSKSSQAAAKDELDRLHSAVERYRATDPTGLMGYKQDGTVNIDDLQGIVNHWGGTGDMTKSTNELAQAGAEIDFAWQRGQSPETEILGKTMAEGFGSREGKAGESWYGLSYAGLPPQAANEGKNEVYFVDGQSVPFIAGTNTVRVPVTGLPQIGRNVIVGQPLTDFSNAPTLDLDRAIALGLSQNAGAGGYGGGGGGSGGGGGGTGGGIFGDAGEDPMRYSATSLYFSPPSTDVALSEVIDTVQSTIHPDAWKDQGGTLASLTFDKGRFVFQPLTAEPQSQMVVDEGRAFLAFMQQNITAIQPLGTLDAAPQQEFAETATIVIYDVRDFKAASGGAIDPKRIADLLMETIDPEGWEEIGGDSGSIKIVQQNLVVRTMPANHAVIAEFLNLVRLALQPLTPEAAAGGEQRLQVPVGQVEIDPAHGTKADRRLVIYDVRDLFAAQPAGLNADAVKQLVDLITDCVEPESWTISGGDTSDIHELDGAFIITTTDAIHQQIHALLDQLRTATRDANTTPVRSPSGNDAGGQAAPAAERVVYWVGDLLSADTTATLRVEYTKQLVDIVQENVDPEGWRALGGDRGDLAVWNDHLVILNSPANQKLIEGLLEQLRAIRLPPERALAAEPAQPHNAAAPQPQMNQAPAPVAPPPAPKESLHARQHRVIDQRLWPVVFPTTDGGSIAVVRSDVSVVVLAADTDASTIARFRAAGLQVDDVSRATKVIAGSIARSKLLALALVDAVRKIEPIAPNAEASKR